MNKRLLVLCLSLVALASQSAFASRAKLMVMGTGDGGMFLLNGGSFYYDEAYNMFYNPSNIVDYKDWFTVEKSNFIVAKETAPTDGAGSATQTTLGDRAQGGGVMGFGNVAVGVYFNRVQALDVIDFGAGSDDTTNHRYLDADHKFDSTYWSDLRPLELFIGGEHGIKWGLGLVYAGASGQDADANYAVNGNYNSGGAATNPDPNLTETEAMTSLDQRRNIKNLKATLGASISGFEPFISVKLKGREHGQDLALKDFRTEMTDKYGGWSAGFRYKYGDWTPYFGYRRDTKERERFTPRNTGDVFNAKPDGGAFRTRDQNDILTQSTHTVWGAGIGRSMKVSETARMMYSISYWKSGYEVEFRTSSTPTSNSALVDSGVGPTRSVKKTVDTMPVDVAIEGDVNSWLTLRAGLGFAIWNRSSGRTPGTFANHYLDSERVGSIQDTTNGRLGASMKFDKLDVDFAIGRSAATAEAAGDLDAQNFSFADGLFGAASATLHF